jgi:hypothetical protein
MMRLVPAALLPVALACAAFQPAPSAHDQFFASLRTLCGHSFAGGLASPPTAADTAFQAPMVVEVRCTADQVRMPLAVGADRSRTWVVTRTSSGLTLKHDHRHADGSEDALSQYGGDATAPGAPGRQEFPADAFSKDLFTRQNLPASLPNVWALEVQPGRRLAYELNRPGRHFRVEFDLSKPR